jgi:glucose-1-phosphate thymidylyltransferase
VKALILAAGYATRMYPLTRDFPKPLLRVRRKPVINYIIEKLNDLDEVDEIIVVTNSKFISKFKEWKYSLNFKKPVSLIDDLTKDNRDRRGAIGDIDFVLKKKRIKEDLLVIGADNLFDGNLDDFLKFTRLHPDYPVIGAYNIKDRESAKKYGVVRLDSRNRLIDFAEKPARPKSTLVAMCLYYFPKEKLNLIEEYINPALSNRESASKLRKSGVNIKSQKIDATGIYINWLRKRLPVYGYVFNGRWYDIGDFKYYAEARKKFR